MTEKKKSKQSKPSQANELQADYGAWKKTIRFFSSFEEENEYVAKERASLSYDQRMLYAEELRKRIYHKYLLPDGKWKPIERVFIVMPPHVTQKNKPLQKR